MENIIDNTQEEKECAKMLDNGLIICDSRVHEKVKKQGGGTFVEAIADMN